MSSWYASGYSARSRARSASAAASPPPALAPGDRDASRVDPEVDGVLRGPRERGVAVVERGRVGVLGREPVLDRHDGGVERVAPPGQARVLTQTAAEHVPAAVDPHDRRRIGGRGSRSGGRRVDANGHVGRTFGAGHDVVAVRDPRGPLARWTGRVVHHLAQGGERRVLECAEVHLADRRDRERSRDLRVEVRRDVHWCSLSDVAAVAPAHVEQRGGDLPERAAAHRIHQHCEQVVAVDGGVTEPRRASRGARWRGGTGSRGGGAAATASRRRWSGRAPARRAHRRRRRWGCGRC